MDEPSQLALVQHNSTVEVYNTTYNDTSNTTFLGESTIATAVPQLITVLSPLMANGYMQNTLNFFLFGTVLETGRRIWQWIMDRFTAGSSLFLAPLSCRLTNFPSHRFRPHRHLRL